MKQNTNKKRGIAKKAVSVSLVAAMLATTNIPVWATSDVGVIEDVTVTDVGNQELPTDNLLTAALLNDVTVVAKGQDENGDPKDYSLENNATIDWNTAITVTPDPADADATYAWTGTWDDKWPGLDTASYTPASADIGKTITCTVRYEDAASNTRELTRSFTVRAVTATQENTTIGDIDALDRVYTGKAIKPEPTVAVKNQFMTSMTVAKDAGFTYSYDNNVNVGKDASVAAVFDGTAGVTGTVSKKFEITNASLPSDMGIKWVESVEDGFATPEVTYSRNQEDYDSVLKGFIDKVTYKNELGDTVTLPKDGYTVQVDNNAAGSTTAVIVGTGNYEGARYDGDAQAVTVAQKDINKCELTPIAEQAYGDVASDGKIYPDAIEITDNSGEESYTLGYKLLPDNDQKGTVDDFTYVVSNNAISGTANVVISGTGNYTGTIQTTFNIAGGLLNGLESLINNSDSFKKGVPYTGKAIDPIAEAQVYGTYQLGRDFTYSITNNVEPGYATVVVTGVNSYANQTFTAHFQIIRAELTAGNTTVKVADTVYDRTATAANAETKYGRPALTVMFDGKKLEENVDYTAAYTYADVVSDKKIAVAIKGIGKYAAGKDAAGNDVLVTKQGNIVRRDIADLQVETIKPQVYTGFEIKPVVVLKDGDYTIPATKTDANYKLSYDNNKQVGTATVKITMDKNAPDYYKGSKTVTFQIVKDEITAYIVNPTATGITDEDQKLKATGAYTAENAASKDGIMLANNSFKVVNAKGQTVDSSKYTVTYSNNRAAGEATIQVTGKDSGISINAANTFTIKPAKIAADGKFKVDGKVVTTFDAQKYTGEPVEIKGLSFEVKDGKYTLVEGKDYKFVYDNNTNVGTNAVVKVEGIGNYSSEAGAITRTFAIGKAEIDVITNVKVPTTVPYAGGLPAEAAITVINPNGGKELVKDVDYTVAYAAETGKTTGDIGTVKATITLSADAAKNYKFVGGLAPSMTATTFTTEYQVVAFNFKDAEVTAIPDQAWTGKAIEPEVEVFAGNIRLKKDASYKVAYDKNTDPGTATITITPVAGIQGFTGSKTVEFKIVKDEVVVGVPQNVKVTTSTSAFKVTWDAVKDATGYVVYEYDKADTKTVTKRYAVKATSKTIKANPGTSRTFVVRAYQTVDKKNVYCKAADAIANKVAGATKPLKTDIKSITAGTKTAKVYTTVGKGAIGAAYCVSYDGGKTYKIVAKGPKGVVGSTNYTMKGLTKGAAVIKIRGYVKDHAGKTVYGDWSKAVKVTIK